MKRTFICLVLIFVFLFSGCGNTNIQDGEYEIWTDEANNYMLTAPEGFIIDTQDPDGFIYVYEKEKSIPYIMIKYYPYEGYESAFESEYIASLKENYSDEGFSLVTRMNNNIGGKKVVVLNSSYKLDGYTVSDTRCILSVESGFYVFTTKEIASLGHNLASELDFVVKNFTEL